MIRELLSLTESLVWGKVKNLSTGRWENYVLLGKKVQVMAFEPDGTTDTIRIRFTITNDTRGFYIVTKNWTECYRYVQSIEPILRDITTYNDLERALSNYRYKYTDPINMENYATQIN